MIRRLKSSALYRSRLAQRACWTRALAISRKLWGDAGGPSPYLRRILWESSRSYQPRFEALPPRLMMDLKDILSRIAEGGTATQSELLPFLTLGERDERVQVNAMLADAYSQSPTAARLAQAKVFIDRAWLLSNFSSDLLPLYVRVNAATGDTDAIRSALKRAGINAARQGRTGEALDLFDRWHYAHHEFEHVDQYEYDFDIMNAVDDLAAPHRNPQRPVELPAEGEKIRIACLARGITEINSILMKINLELAKHRDRTRFDVTLFVPEQLSAVLASPQGRDHIAAFAELGCPVIAAPDIEDSEQVLLELAARIKDFRPHIMLTSAALADFRSYFITALRPAPIQVGLVQGPPPQFASPTLDWCIVWTRHPLLDTPVDSSWVRIYLDWPDSEGVQALDRSELNLPQDACVLLSGGRDAKFQNRDFWKVIAEVLSEHPHAYYVAVGVTEDRIPFLADVVPAEVRSRVRCLGWREDFLRILAASDIVIDTYPNGGGQVIVQAMSAGIPIVAQRNDYLRPFDQNDWSPVEDFLKEPDLLVERGDFAAFKQVLTKLVTNPEYRREAGLRCRAQHLSQADPAAAARRCEEIYTQLIARFAAESARR